MAQPKETRGNYLVYGKDGERIAAFATEEDMTTFVRHSQNAFYHDGQKDKEDSAEGQEG